MHKLKCLLLTICITLVLSFFANGATLDNTKARNAAIQLFKYYKSLTTLQIQYKDSQDKISSNSPISLMITGDIVSINPFVVYNANNDNYYEISNAKNMLDKDTEYVGVNYFKGTKFLKDKDGKLITVFLYDGKLPATATNKALIIKRDSIKAQMDTLSSKINSFKVLNGLTIINNWDSNIGYIYIGQAKNGKGEGYGVVFLYENGTIMDEGTYTSSEKDIEYFWNQKCTTPISGGLTQYTDSGLGFTINYPNNFDNPKSVKSNLYDFGYITTIINNPNIKMTFYGGYIDDSKIDSNLMKKYNINTKTCTKLSILNATKSYRYEQKTDKYIMIKIATLKYGEVGIFNITVKTDSASIAKNPNYEIVNKIIKSLKLSDVVG